MFRRSNGDEDSRKAGGFSSTCFMVPLLPALSAGFFAPGYWPGRGSCTGGCCAGRGGGSPIGVSGGWLGGGGTCNGGVGMGDSVGMGISPVSDHHGSAGPAEGFRLLRGAMSRDTALAGTYRVLVVSDRHDGRHASFTP